MNQAQPDKLYDHHRQQLSAMLDGELAPDEARFMLRRLEHDSDLATCWERWQVCGDILRGRHDALLPAGFSQRVLLAITEAEAGPQLAVAQDGNAARRPRWGRWGSGAALAASVAVAALFVARQPGSDSLEPSAPAPSMQMAATSGPQPAPVRTQTPSAPAPTAPDTATLAAATVALADVPRRAVERRSRPQRESARSATERLVATAARTPASAVLDQSSVPLNTTPVATTVALAGTATQEAASAPQANDPFVTQSAQSRPWPRTILGDYTGNGALNASYGTSGGNPFLQPHLDPSQAGAQPQASANRTTGPR